MRAGDQRMGPYQPNTDSHPRRPTRNPTDPISNPKNPNSDLTLLIHMY